MIYVDRRSIDSPSVMSERGRAGRLGSDPGTVAPPTVVVAVHVPISTNS